MCTLQYEIAKKLYEEIKTKSTASTIEDFDEFYTEFLQAATDYASTRLAWSFMDKAARSEDDSARSIKHDAFMARLNAICRVLKVEGIDEIMSDRKAKGDFACYVALFLALEQR